MSSQRYRRVLNADPSPRAQEYLVPRETTEQLELRQMNERGILRGEAAEPEMVDLVEAWWEVNDQGETGSCVGWAVCDGALRWQFVKAGLLKPDKHLSPRYIWMAAKETDDMTTEPTTFIESAYTKLRAALDIAKNFGVVLNDDLPFKEPRLFRGSVADFYEKAQQLKISSFECLGQSTVQPSVLRTWLKEIKDKGGSISPILVRLDVDDGFVALDPTTGLPRTDTPLTVGGEQFPSLENHDLSSALRRPGGSGHFAVLVGYLMKPDGKTYFKIRNSWGKGWGKDGHAYLSEDYVFSAVTEAWITRLGS